MKIDMVVRLTYSDGSARKYREIEYEVLWKAYNNFGGNLQKMASTLKLGRSTLYRKGAKEWAKERRKLLQRERKVYELATPFGLGSAMELLGELPKSKSDGCDCWGVRVWRSGVGGCPVRWCKFLRKQRGSSQSGGLGVAGRCSSAVFYFHESRPIYSAVAQSWSIVPAPGRLMPNPGYKQSPEHKVKTSGGRATAVLLRAAASRRAYMKCCAERYGFPDVESYRKARVLYWSYKYKRTSTGKSVLSFEDYLLAQRARSNYDFSIVPEGPLRELIINCARKQPTGIRMRNYRFAFYITEKVRTKNWGKLLAQGARVHGDVVETRLKEDFTEPLADFDGCGNMGLSRAAKRLMDTHLAAGKYFLFFDKGYTNRSFMRVSVNAWQPLAYFQRFMRSSDRLEQNGMHIHPRQKRDPSKAIVFAGACQNYTSFMGLGNVNDYNLSVLKKLRDNTDRVIVYRPNPSWYTKHQDEFRPIHEEVARVELSTPEVGFKAELARCHLLVTHGTGAAVAAVSSGIGSMVLGPGICRPVSMTEADYDKLDTPDFEKSSVIHQFFSDLHYCQWSEEEYRNGAAWAEIRLVLAALGNEDAAVDNKALIDQYKLMHAHPEYFRGLTTLKYAKQIQDTLAKVGGAETLLDYGSGKGEQYDSPHNIQGMWGLPDIKCYDPAVPKFSQLPLCRFDAVICCDVMEHVPEYDVVNTLRTVIGYAKKVVFIAIATTPATKTLPDGRNCHVTVRPPEWWWEKVREALPRRWQGPEVVLSFAGKDV